MKKLIPFLGAAFIALTAALPAAAQEQKRETDAEFILRVEKDCFNFFASEVNKENGLFPDSSRTGSPCSIAATGFGLTAMCIGVENKWIPKNEAYLIVLQTLKTFQGRLEEQHGFYYHFLSMDEGKRVWDCEVSSIDTALFMAGALTAAEYFKGTEIDRIANELYARVDWQWMQNGRRTVCMGWKPDRGFLPYYWESYNELMILYVLGIGSPNPKRALPPEAWDAWARPKARYGGKEFVFCFTGSLFVYQYAHAWVDFRKVRDSYADYWQNSLDATLANRQYCVDNMRNFQGFGEKMWGLTACIGPSGYKGYGGGPGNPACDGTIAPSAVGGSVPFAPDICIATLRNIHDQYGDRIYGPYGFKNAFNLNLDWWCDEYLGIDTGITLLMIENYRTGFVWKYFMAHPSVQKWAKLCMKPISRTKLEEK